MTGYTSDQRFIARRARKATEYPSIRSNCSEGVEEV